MKKIVSVILASILLSCGAFARGVYSGSVSVNADFSTIKIWGAERNLTFSDGSSTPVHPQTNMEGLGFAIDIQSWNLWNLNKVVGLGFAFSMDFNYGTGKLSYIDLDKYTGEYPSSGKYTHIAAFLGFAAGFNINDIVKIQGAVGLSVPFVLSEAVSAWSMILPGISFVTDWQIKFLPAKLFSPLIGYRFEVSNAGLWNLMMLHNAYLGCAINF